MNPGVGCARRRVTVVFQRGEPGGDETAPPQKAILRATHVCLPDGSMATLRLFARAGATGIMELTERGEPHFCELRRISTHRMADKGAGSGQIPLVQRVRADNVRVVSPSDPYLPHLDARRNDAESINRGVESALVRPDGELNLAVPVPLERVPSVTAAAPAAGIPLLPFAALSRRGPIRACPQGTGGSRRDCRRPPHLSAVGASAASRA